MVAARLLAACALTLMSLPALAAPVAYALDPAESRVGFIWYFGNDEVTGQMPVSAADIVIDFDQASRSRVSVTLDIARASAGNPLADPAMKGPKVLWAEKFPTITFQSTRVRARGDGAVIEGNLTLRGVTRPVALDAQLFRRQGSAEGDRSRLTFFLQTTISRSAFGADGFADLVADRVRLDIVARISASP